MTSVSPKHIHFPNAFLLISMLTLSSLVWGQDLSSSTSNPPSASTESSCANSPVISIPSRPTIASATDPTECGVVEAEYGFESLWPGAGARRDDFTGGLRVGLTRNLDFHWSSGDYLSLSDSTGTRSGMGDSWLGLKYRFLMQTKNRPSLGVFYSAKIPSASAALGGSGQADHALAFLVSKDIHPLHFDFNVIPQFVGRVGGGFDHNVGFALSTWLPLTKKLSLVAEPYGFTGLNQNTPAYASVMAGFCYQVKPRFFVDTGIDFGATNGATHKRVYAGATFAIGNYRRLFQPSR